MERGVQLTIVYSRTIAEPLGACLQTERYNSAGKRPLRFELRDSNPKHRNRRFSRLFEHSADYDSAVLGIMANGFRIFDDFDGATLTEVFSGVPCDFAQRRDIIDQMRDYGLIYVTY